MTGVPAIHNPGSIEQLLTRLRETDPPKVADRNFLEELGFRRGADERLLELLAFLGYIDDHGQPTVLWKRSRDPGAGAELLGRAVRAAYGPLFREIPDAITAEGPRLMEFFRRAADGSDREAAYMVLTFKVLCDLAEFPVETGPEPDREEPAEPVGPPRASGAAEEDAEESGRMEEGAPASSGIRVCMQIDITEDADPELTGLLKRYLKSRMEEQGR